MRCSLEFNFLRIVRAIEIRKSARLRRITRRISYIRYYTFYRIVLGWNAMPKQKQNDQAEQFGDRRMYVTSAHSKATRPCLCVPLPRSLFHTMPHSMENAQYNLQHERENNNKRRTKYCISRCRHHCLHAADVQAITIRCICTMCRALCARCVCHHRVLSLILCPVLFLWGKISSVPRNAEMQKTKSKPS